MSLQFSLISKQNKQKKKKKKKERRNTTVRRPNKTRHEWNKTHQTIPGVSLHHHFFWFGWNKSSFRKVRCESVLALIAARRAYQPFESLLAEHHLHHHHHDQKQWEHTQQAPMEPQKRRREWCWKGPTVVRQNKAITKHGNRGRLRSRVQTMEGFCSWLKFLWEFKSLSNNLCFFYVRYCKVLHYQTTKNMSNESFGWGEKNLSSIALFTTRRHKTYTTYS